MSSTSAFSPTQKPHFFIISQFFGNGAPERSLAKQSSDSTFFTEIFQIKTSKYVDSTYFVKDKFDSTFLQFWANPR